MKYERYQIAIKHIDMFIDVTMKLQNIPIFSVEWNNDRRSRLNQSLSFQVSVYWPWILIRNARIGTFLNSKNAERGCHAIISWHLEYGSIWEERAGWVSSQLSWRNPTADIIRWPKFISVRSEWSQLCVWQHGIFHTVCEISKKNYFATRFICRY